MRPVLLLSDAAGWAGGVSFCAGFLKAAHMPDNPEGWGALAFGVLAWYIGQRLAGRTSRRQISEAVETALTAYAERQFAALAASPPLSQPSTYPQAPEALPASENGSLSSSEQSGAG